MILAALQIAFWGVSVVFVFLTLVYATLSLVGRLFSANPHWNSYLSGSNSSGSSLASMQQTVSKPSSDEVSAALAAAEEYHRRR